MPPSRFPPSPTFGDSSSPGYRPTCRDNTLPLEVDADETTSSTEMRRFLAAEMQAVQMGGNQGSAQKSLKRLAYLLAPGLRLYQGFVSVSIALSVTGTAWVFSLT